MLNLTKIKQDADGGMEFSLKTMTKAQATASNAGWPTGMYAFISDASPTPALCRKTATTWKVFATQGSDLA